jgi:hypothetical protein
MPDTTRRLPEAQADKPVPAPVPAPLPLTRSRLNFERELERTRQFLDDDWRGTSLDGPQSTYPKVGYA